MAASRRDGDGDGRPTRRVGHCGDRGDQQPGFARGDPYTELRRVADEVRADAVIVGASMQAGHRWIGSLAVRLVKAGRWPVTVVP